MLPEVGGKYYPCLQSREVPTAGITCMTLIEPGGNSLWLLDAVISVV